MGSALFLNDPYFPSGLAGAKAKDMAALSTTFNGFHCSPGSRRETGEKIQGGSMLLSQSRGRCPGILTSLAL